MSTTRRYPRTLQQAFGPYCSNEVHPMPDRGSAGERMAGAVLAIVGGIALAVLLFHHLSK